MSFVVTESDPVPAEGVFGWLTAADGTRFRVARFGPASASHGTVVLLNGRSEFIEKYFEVIGNLLERGYAVATLDWRGQGMSDRPLENPHKGHVENFDLFISDLRQAVADFIEPGCPPPYRLLSHSMGGNIGLRFLQQYPETFTSAVFSAPMWGIGKYARTPLWMRTVGFCTELLGLRERYVPAGKDYGESDRTFEGNVLTHDPERFHRFVAQVIAEPKLELGAPTLGWVRQAIRSMDMIHAAGFVEAIRTPVRVCTAGADALVSLAAQKLVVDRLPNGEQIVVAGSKHELLMETETHRGPVFAVFDEL